MNPVNTQDAVDFMNAQKGIFSHYEQLCVNFHTMTALQMVKIAHERTQSQLTEAQKAENRAFLQGIDYAISILEREA